MSIYPNIEAIANGTISGAFRNWPKVRPEAKALLAELDLVNQALEQLEQISVLVGKRPGESCEDAVRRLINAELSALCQAREAEAKLIRSDYEIETPLGQALMDGSEE